MLIGPPTAFTPAGLLKSNTPVLTVVVPVKVLGALPLSVSVPVPCLVMLPEPLSTRSIAEIVKKHAARIGLDAEQFSAHSLRAGFITSAAKSGAGLFKIMDVSRHRSVETVRGYVRDAEMFKEHAGEAFL